MRLISGAALAPAMLSTICLVTMSSGAPSTATNFGSVAAMLALLIMVPAEDGRLDDAAEMPALHEVDSDRAFSDRRRRRRLRAFSVAAGPREHRRQRRLATPDAARRRGCRSAGM